MKKRYALALATGMALGNIFSAAAQEAAPPLARDPFACVETFFMNACPSIAGEYLAARVAMREGRWAEASDLLESVAAQDPDTAQPRSEALRAAVLAGRYERAEAHLDALARLDKGDPLAAILRAARFARAEDRDAAVAALDEARNDGSPESELAALLLENLPDVMEGTPEKTGGAAFAFALGLVAKSDYNARMNALYMHGEKEAAIAMYREANTLLRFAINVIGYSGAPVKQRPAPAPRR
jgi:tetratricopeptide (TPR) repeat protein